MTRLLPSILGIATAMLLLGCTSDDPNEGGFFGGLVGLGSGAYQDRVADETAALSAEQARYDKEVADGETLDGAFKQRQSYALDVELELVSLRREIEDLGTEIEALEREQTITRDEVATAEADVISLRQDIDRLEAERQAHEQAKALGADAGPDTDPAEFGEPSPEEVSRLRAYINKLQEAVDALKSARDRRQGEVPSETSGAAD